MKKYKEWLVNEINVMESETSENYPHEQMVEREVVLNLIDQLDQLDQFDEPEALSQEWVDENSTNLPMSSPMTRWVPVGKLQNLIIPKQELPVIPKYVADWIEKYRERESNVWHLLNNVSIQKDCNLELWSWLWGENNVDMLARAWLDGYEVEEEKLYRIEMYGTDGLLLTLEGDEYYFDEPLDYVGERPDIRQEFTESEIKAIDERYWTFAVPMEVTELF